MKRFYLALLLLSVSLFAYTGNPLRRSQQYLDYIEMYKDMAIDQMYKYGIPASITIAQGLLESGAGKSELAIKANNHFGIKCGGDWMGPTAYHDDDKSGECFRSYSNVCESFEDHSLFLKMRSRYARLFTLDRHDYKGWAYGLKAAGYATAKTYASALISIIENYELYKLDDLSPRKDYNYKNTNKNANSLPKSNVASQSSKSQQHTIYKYNNNCYILVRQGDTFKSLSKELGISERKLAKYNERDKSDKLIKGEVIYLNKKAKKADKKYKNIPHVVRQGESMYSIAQRYGIRLENLYKINHLSPDYQIMPGDKLMLR